MEGIGYASRPVGGNDRTVSVRPSGVLKARIDSLNRIGNLLSEDASAISIELDRICGSVPQEAGKSAGERPEMCDLDSFQSQLDRLDRLAQFVHGQLDRLRAV